MKSIELLLLGGGLFIASLFMKYLLDIEPKGISMAFGIIMAGGISYIFEFVGKKNKED